MFHKNGCILAHQDNMLHATCLMHLVQKMLQRSLAPNVVTPNASIISACKHWEEAENAPEIGGA